MIERYCLRYDITGMYNPVFNIPRTSLLLFLDECGNFLTCHLDYWGLEWRMLGLVHKIGGD